MEGEARKMTAAIAGIAGSLRAGSHTRALLRAAAGNLPPGLRLTIWDGLARVPPFNEDLEAAPAPGGVAELRQLIGAADAVLIATPEYNGSIPGQLKNALDWASRPRGAAVLEGKPTAVISASPSPRGGARALADLRKILTVIGADVSDAELAVPQVHTRLTPAGQLDDPDLARRIAELLSKLAEHATRHQRGARVSVDGEGIISLSSPFVEGAHVADASGPARTEAA
jgi:chromate reductase